MQSVAKPNISDSNNGRLLGFILFSPTYELSHYDRKGLQHKIYVLKHIILSESGKQSVSGSREFKVNNMQMLTELVN